MISTKFVIFIYVFNKRIREQIWFFLDAFNIEKADSKS